MQFCFPASTCIHAAFFYKYMQCIEEATLMLDPSLRLMECTRRLFRFAVMLASSGIYSSPHGTQFSNICCSWWQSSEFKFSFSCNFNMCADAVHHEFELIRLTKQQEHFFLLLLLALMLLVE